jgi:outer membrane lipoprotein carrier protein
MKSVRRMKWVANVAIFIIALYAINTQAIGQNSINSLAVLDTYLKSTQSGKADFTQVVTSPPKTSNNTDEKAVAKVKTSTGTFEFVRPNRFKFSYKKPFEQTIVADGTTLWLYDLDLNQITAKKQSQTLGSTPAALIASAPNLKALEAQFKLQNAPDADGLQWVLASPKQADGQIQTIKVGLKTGADKSVSLSVLEILDSFGQRSVMTFSNSQVNPKFSAEAFKFTPPTGVDVIR